VNPKVGIDQDVVVHLAVPAGTPALFMEATYTSLATGGTLADTSQELLLGRDLRYAVRSVIRVGARWHVYGTVFPRG
jgi:hypothetical protein